MNASATTSFSPSPLPLALAAKVAYMTEKLHMLQLFLLSGYGTMFLLCGVLVGYMRYNRNVALRGDATAARKIILPAFEPLLWILGAATGVYTLFFATALCIDLYTSEISKVATEFFYSGRQFVFVTVLVFLYQKSVSIPALRRTVFLSFMLSSYTIPVVWYLVNYSNSADFYLVLMFVRGLLMLLYAFVLIRPPARASKRTLREYCVYAFAYYALLFSYTEMFRQKRIDLGFSLTYANLLWGSLCPLVIWRVLKADTEHWRGLGQRAVALQGLFRQRRSALDERISSQGFHLLIELHRKYIIDFAYLDIREQIGVGASATVFHGLLHSKTRVAVKVYTPTELNEETVAAFSHEAALCGALHHPNIVKFYGMCVCPPTICLVSELCRGSLEDVMVAMHRKRERLGPQRQQLLIDIAYMLDAARAVAYLHSFSPPFVHRDIKPSNFLVDENSTVKLTDFGESRSLPHANGGARDLHPYMALASGAYVSHDGRYSGNTNHLALSSSSTALSGSFVGPGGNQVMTVRGTVDYMAPEVINGRAGMASYGEAADVYSLAITMWDILHPGREKFPALRNNHLLVFESVIEGKRPVLEEHIHPSVRGVIQSAWQSDVRLRPSAQNIVHILESIQEEVQAVFASHLLNELHTDVKPTALDNTDPSLFGKGSFSGADAVEHMVMSGYATYPAEAIRMGNALMDAGLMHHLRHAQAFEDNEELYYLDEDNISLCRPLLRPGSSTSRTKIPHLHEEEEKDSERTYDDRSRVNTATSSSDFDRSARIREVRAGERPLLEHHGLCACRKLGQRVERSRSAKEKRGKKSRNIRISPIMEEIANTGLTRSLLTADERASALDSYDHIAININGPAAA